MWIFIVLVIPGVLARDIPFLEILRVTPMYRNIRAQEQKEVHCPSNMLFDSTENECECVPETVYYPPKDSCFNAFEQGPCKPGHYLAIPTDANVAECVVNTCGNNGTLPYMNSCSYLNTRGPCKFMETMQVNWKSEIFCGEDVTGLHYRIIRAPIIGCVRGTRRIARGKCRKLI